MLTDASENHEPMLIAACEICSQLAEVETSYVKYGRPEDTTILPPAAARLQTVGQGEIRRCPVCGTFYSYSSSYDYFVNGAEEDEILTRLTPDQARAYLTESEYARRLALFTTALQDPAPLNRRYAARCRVSFHLARRESGQVAACLRHADSEVVRSAALFLCQLSAERNAAVDLASLTPELEALRHSADVEVARAANVMLWRLEGRI